MLFYHQDTNRLMINSHMKNLDQKGRNPKKNFENKNFVCFGNCVITSLRCFGYYTVTKTNLNFLCVS